jgi:hypothetical protein
MPRRDKSRKAKKEPLTLFSWGYWGWGNATAEFMQSADAIETSRGFQPPFFVDVRIRRTGRAEGFKGDNFANLVGRDRHRWMKSLGNRQVATGRGPPRIDNPAAAEELLDLAVRLHAQKQRLLFFCACKHVRENGEMACHRDMVADLVLDAARRRGLSVRVVEWPGGEPEEFEIELSPKEWKAFVAGRQSIPIDDPDWGEMAGPPWGSLFTLKCGEDSAEIIGGPVKFERQWVLPILKRIDEEDEAAAEQEAYRQDYGLDSREV